MHYLKDFCRVCLRSEILMQDLKKNLNDENSDTLLNKLQTCVTEVEWSTMRNVLICNSCVDRLNSAFEFKRQCLSTTKVLASYTVQLEKAKSEPKSFRVDLSRKDVGQDIIDKYVKQAAQKSVDKGKLQQALQVKPVIKRFLPALPSIVVAPINNNNNNQNTFQNIFLNLIPTPPKAKTNCNEKIVKQPPKNNSVYMNINNAYHKVFPLTPSESTNILSQFSTVPDTTTLSNGTGQMEELSVELDPSMFDCTPEVESIPDSEGNDWEDLISSNKICPGTVAPASVDKNIPLQLPNEVQPNLEDYFNIDHFMALKEAKPKAPQKSFPCVTCGKVSDTFKALIDHIGQVHAGNFPYTCSYCLSTFAVTAHYENHIQEHTRFFSNPLHKDMLTLDDVSVQNESVLFPKTNITLDDDSDYDVKVIEPFSTFSRPTKGSKKKYFVKGVKNAKCHICEREFSTQSYLQSHIKLHERKSDYRLKVHDESNKKTSSLEVDFENEISKSEIIIDNYVKSSESIVSSSLRTLLEGKNLKEAEDKEDLMEDCEEIASEPVVEFQDREVIDVIDDGLNPMSDVSAENSMDCDAHLEGSDQIKEEESPNERRPPYLQLTTENGKPQCNICFKVFSRRHDLKRHMNNIHLKTIQYTCHLCNSYFYEAFHLTRHLRIHVGFVKCTICFKDFSAVRDLKFHIMGSHDNCASGQCGMCGQHFQRIKHLREHMQEHENSILYKCHICGDEFRESRELTRHLVGHSGMYSCSLCATTLSNEHELSNHMKCHNEFTQTERKYACSFCSNRYKEKRYLNLHMRNVHPVEYENI